MGNARPQPHEGSNLAEARVRMQAAFREWVIALGSEERLVIAVDDLHACDDSSAAILLELARAAMRTRALLLTTCRTDQSDEAAPAAQALAQAARRIPLAPLTKHEANELLSSALADVDNGPRLANRLHVLSGGNPRHFLDVAEHLVESNVIGYVDGAWVVPMDIAEESLPRNQEAALRARLASLSAQARQLARVLSIRSASTAIELCSAMSGLEGPRLFDLLDELVQHAVLVSSDGNYHFSSAPVRELLLAELDAGTRRKVHRVLGEELLGWGDLTTLEQLEAAVHLLQAGETKRGAPIACRAALRIGVHELEHLSGAVPALEKAAALLEGVGAPPRQMIAVLGTLAIAGLFCQRRLAVRYGDAAMRAFEATFHLPMAKRLGPMLGRKLGLGLALGRAFVSLAFAGRSSGVPSFNSGRPCTPACFVCSRRVKCGPSAPTRHDARM